MIRIFKKIKKRSLAIDRSIILSLVILFINVFSFSFFFFSFFQGIRRYDAHDAERDLRLDGYSK